MEKVLKIGVIGVGRGSSMWNYCKTASNAKLVAVCDNWVEGLEKAKRDIADDSVTYYTDYDEFLKHDMDVVMLANYATEHAPFAVKAMEAGKNVISEVLTACTMAEAVALIECVERTGKKYCYAENYCYMDAPREMRRRYKNGDLGEFQYGEGEYVHNCEPIWPQITHGDPNHWRNTKHALFYCTHSAGPLIHITGKRPASVIGFEIPLGPAQARMGELSGAAGVEMVTFEDGSVFKSVHGGLSKNSIWYTIYGTKGRMESARESAELEKVNRIYVNVDPTDEVEVPGKENTYLPKGELDEKAKEAGHGGSDYYCLYNAIEYIKGDESMDVISVYEATDMWMVGHFGYLSVLAGNMPMQIPDLRKKEMRDLYRYDNRCSIKHIGKESTFPSYSKGNPVFPPQVYERIYKLWREKEDKR